MLSSAMRTRIVILAAGQGRRMGRPDFPKALIPLRGKPLVHYVYDAALASGVDSQPVVVVGARAEMVKESLGARPVYVHQPEQRGTGDAVRCAEPALRGAADAIIVLYGDMPFVKSDTIRQLRDAHVSSRPAIMMLTTRVSDFDEWRAPLYDFGRVVRDGRGNIMRSVERKDATPEELFIKELNPCICCFDAAWLWNNLGKLGNNNAQKEYYLTDLVRIAIDDGQRVVSMDVNPLETVGINMPEHLKFAAALAKPAHF